MFGRLPHKTQKYYWIMNMSKSLYFTNILITQYLYAFLNKKEEGERERDSISWAITK